MSTDIVERLRVDYVCDEHTWKELEEFAIRNDAADEIVRLRAERDDHKQRLAVEAVTAPDADYDTMMDSLQARLRDLHAEMDRLRAEVAVLRDDPTIYKHQCGHCSRLSPLPFLVPGYLLKARRG